MMFFWIILIAILIIYLVRGNQDVRSFQKKRSIDLLDERLAKGEISIEEYYKIKDTLKGE